jgi:hypothetical protein
MLLQTSDILAMLGMETGRWASIMQRHHYPAAPPMPPPGRARVFDRDDAAALACFDHLTRMGSTMSRAGKVAAQIRELLRTLGDDTDFIWVVLGRSDSPLFVTAERPPPDQTVLEFPIAHIRAEIELFVLGKTGGAAS